jgi:hypothetical protein
MGFGKPFLRESMGAQKHYPKCYGDLEISHIWASLMATKKFFFCYGTFSIKDGSYIRFWEDSWIGDSPLSEQYAALYSIVHHKSDTIALVKATSPRLVA